MYMNIEISEKDRKYFRFLWREQENSKLKVFEFSRLISGGNASPFLAQLVSRKNAENNKNEFPRAYETVLHSTYMDDSMDSVENTNKGIDLYKQLSKLWERADMCARKWLTNDPKVQGGPKKRDTSKYGRNFLSFSTHSIKFHTNDLGGRINTYITQFLPSA